jgi:hypothetical protein
LEQAGDDLFGSDAVGFRRKGQDEAMAQDR